MVYSAINALFMYLVLFTIVASHTCTIVDADHPLGQLAIQAQQESVWTEKQEKNDIYRVKSESESFILNEKLSASYPLHSK